MHVIDAHAHLDVDFGGGWILRPASALVDVLDAAGIDALVDLSGGWGTDVLRRHLDHFKAVAPERFVMLGGVPWPDWPRQGRSFPERAARSVQFQFAAGAAGLKVWKPLGLQVCDERGALVAVDDERLDPIWQTCADAGRPVVIHVADPPEFFEPIGPANPRSQDLVMAPEWHWYQRSPARFDALVEQFAALLNRWPGVTFVAAHMLDLFHAPAILDQLLSQHANLLVDLGARFTELARATPQLRAVLFRHHERVLFGLDHPATVAAYDEAIRTTTEAMRTAVAEADPAGDVADVLDCVLYANAARTFAV